jgi:hypothetical protein
MNKKKPIEEHNKNGRPTVMTERVLKKLEDSFLEGLSDVQACLLAGITEKTLYNYCKEHEDFLQRKEQLKEMPKLLARRNIAKAIMGGDKEASKWYLERKEKAEFSPRQEIEQSGSVENHFIIEHIE